MEAKRTLNHTEYAKKERKVLDKISYFLTQNRKQDFES